MCRFILFRVDRRASHKRRPQRAVGDAPADFVVSVAQDLAADFLRGSRVGCLLQRLLMQPDEQGMQLWLDRLVDRGGLACLAFRNEPASGPYQAWFDALDAGFERPYGRPALSKPCSRQAGSGRWPARLPHVRLRWLRRHSRAARARCGNTRRPTECSRDTCRRGRTGSGGWEGTASLAFAACTPRRSGCWPCSDPADFPVDAIDELALCGCLPARRVADVVERHTEVATVQGLNALLRTPLAKSLKDLAPLDPLSLGFGHALPQKLNDNLAVDAGRASAGEIALVGLRDFRATTLRFDRPADDIADDPGRC